MCLFCIQQINFVMSLVANNNRVTVPPTFHPLPSLLNVIDFESESETDKTTHIRKRLPFRERQELHAITDLTHTTWFVPPLEIQMPPDRGARLCLVGKPNTTSPIWNHFHSCHPSVFVKCLQVHVIANARLVRFVLVRLSPNWPNMNETAINGRCQQEMWQHKPRFLFHRERVQTRTCPLAWWRNSEPCLLQHNRSSLSTGHLNFVAVRQK